MPIKLRIRKSIKIKPKKPTPIPEKAAPIPEKLKLLISKLIALEHEEEQVEKHTIKNRAIISKWKRAGWESITDGFDRIKPQTFIRYVRKDEEPRGGGVVIVNNIQDKYFVVVNPSNHIKWSLQYHDISQVWVKKKIG